MLAPDALASWIRAELGARHVATTGQIGGSSSATIHTVRITTVSGLEQLAVAKVFDRPHVSGADAFHHVVGEVDHLQLAHGAHLAVPQPLAFEATGDVLGAPVVVMTRLPGNPLPRPTVAGWIEGFSTTLRSIAAADVDIIDLSSATSWRDPTLQRPDWFGDVALWNAAVVRVDAGLVGSRDRFIHRDFHPGNVLWHQARVSGVVDWVHACRGPIDFDIASCRVNLALTAGIDAAEAFTRELGGLGVGYDRAWDVDKALSLAAYAEVLLTGNDFGAGLTLDGIRRSLVEVIRAALSDPFMRPRPSGC